MPLTTPVTDGCRPVKIVMCEGVMVVAAATAFSKIVPPDPKRSCMNGDVSSG